VQRAAGLLHGDTNCLSVTAGLSREFDFLVIKLARQSSCGTIFWVRIFSFANYV
jgi:hypothetical protein